MFSGSFLESVAQNTSGFIFSDLLALVQKAVLHIDNSSIHSNNSSINSFTKDNINNCQASPNSSNSVPSLSEFFLRSSKLDYSYFAESLKHFDEIMAETIGAPKIPAVNWQDVGNNNPQ